MSAPLPFLRWAGGKRKLLPTIIPLLPACFEPSTNRFFEPFVGGGALMLALGDPDGDVFVPGRKLVINDANPELIATYLAIRDDVEALIRAIGKLAKDTSRTQYDKVKKSNPSSNVARGARFIFLNRTCFNGLWRVNGKGEFNVPYAKLVDPFISDAAHLRAVSARLAGAQIRLGSYVTAVNDAKAGDVVYFDPPYLPLTPSASFSKYAKDDFGQTEQYALSGVIRSLTDRGVFVVCSNSDTPLTRQIFGPELDLWQISVTRSISAAAASRTRVNEVLGVNFHPATTSTALTHLQTPPRPLLSASPPTP